MFNKLRSNFRLSRLIVRILFVLTFIFANWQDTLFTSNLVLQMSGLSTDLALPLMFLSCIISALILIWLLSVAVNWLLNAMRVFNVPRAEYNLILLLFFSLGFFACGIFNLVHLFTPVLLTWGAVLFPLISSLGCAIGFYSVTAKLYFNDVTRPYYFKNLAIIYVVLAVVLGVLA